MIFFARTSSLGRIISSGGTFPSSKANSSRRFFVLLVKVAEQATSWVFLGRFEITFFVSSIISTLISLSTSSKMIAFTFWVFIFLRWINSRILDGLPIMIWGFSLSTSIWRLIGVPPINKLDFNDRTLEAFVLIWEASS